MRPQLSLHQRQSVVVQVPRLGPSLAIAFLGLALSLVMGCMATCALTGEYPSWLGAARPSPANHWGYRWLLIVLGFAGGVAGLLTAFGYFGRAWHFLSLRLGLRPVRESVGPCTVMEEEPGLWGLQLSLAAGEEAPGSTPLTTRLLPSSHRSLIFRCDEAAAAAISRLFHPGEVLLVRWLDSPFALWGPLLLEVRSRGEARMSSALPEEEEWRRAA